MPPSWYACQGNFTSAQRAEIKVSRPDTGDSDQLEQSRINTVLISFSDDATERKSCAEVIVSSKND
jgi:hypothetical protein